MMFSLYLVTSILSVGSIAAPAPVLEIQDDAERVSEKRLKDVKNTHKGIYWDLAAQNCPKWKFDILTEATRMGMELAKWRGDENGYDSRFVFTPGFNRYFAGSKQWDVSIINQPLVICG